MTDILKPEMGGGRGLLRQEFEIHKTERMRIVAVYWVAPSSDPKRKHINLRIEQYKKNPTDAVFPVEPSQKINLEENDMTKLLASVRAQDVLKDLSTSDRVVVLRGDHPGDLLDLTDRDISSIKELVDSLSDDNIQRLAKTVDAGVIEKIESAVRYQKMEESLRHLRQLMAEDSDEGILQGWFDENTWVFGKQYVGRVPKRTIGLESRADIIYLSVDGFADLVELKRSKLSHPLLLSDPSHKSFYPSAELSKSLAQAMHYIQVIEDHRLQLVQLVKIPVLRPTVTIIVGRSNDWSEPMKEHLRILNSSLVSINVVTYDHLVEMGQSMLNLYFVEKCSTDNDP